MPTITASIDNIFIRFQQDSWTVCLWLSEALLYQLASSSRQISIRLSSVLEPPTSSYLALVVDTTLSVVVLLIPRGLSFADFLHFLKINKKVGTVCLIKCFFAAFSGHTLVSLYISSEVLDPRPPWSKFFIFRRGTVYNIRSKIKPRKCQASTLKEFLAVQSGEEKMRMKISWPLLRYLRNGRDPSEQVDSSDEASGRRALLLGLKWYSSSRRRRWMILEAAWIVGCLSAQLFYFAILLLLTDRCFTGWKGPIINAIFWGFRPYDRFRALSS